MQLQLPETHVQSLRGLGSLRTIRFHTGLSKDVAGTIVKTGVVKRRHTLLRLNLLFRRAGLPELEWEAGCFGADLTSSQAIRLEGWPLFFHIRSLFIARNEHAALATAFPALNSDKVEQWSFAGWGFLYAANGSGQPEYFAGAARQLLHRFEQEKASIAPEQLYLMATDIAKFEIEYGQAALAEPLYDRLIELLPRLTKRLDTGQQAATWRGHGIMKASRSKFRIARASYKMAEDVHANNVESRTGNFYRLAQLSLKDASHDYQRQLDALWAEVGQQVTLPPEPSATSPDRLPLTAISQPTRLNALLLQLARPEIRQRPKEFQQRLDEFALKLSKLHPVHQPLFQRQPAMFALAQEATSPQTREILQRYIRPQIDLGMAQGVHRLLTLLVQRVEKSL